VAGSHLHSSRHLRVLGPVLSGALGCGLALMSVREAFGLLFDGISFAALVFVWIGVGRWLVAVSDDLLFAWVSLAILLVAWRISYVLRKQ